MSICKYKLCSTKDALTKEKRAGHVGFGVFPMYSCIEFLHRGICAFICVRVTSLSLKPNKVNLSSLLVGDNDMMLIICSHDVIYHDNNSVFVKLPTSRHEQDTCSNYSIH